MLKLRAARIFWRVVFGSVIHVLVTFIIMLNVHQKCTLTVWEHFELRIVIAEPGFSNLTVKKRRRKAIEEGTSPLGPQHH